VLRDTNKGIAKPLIQTPHFTIDLAAQRVTRDGHGIPLTWTEWKIVQLLVRNPGCLVTQRQLLAEIWA
jgi:two-component system, OmpR family, KDP operon response regulator KdpE